MAKNTLRIVVMLGVLAVLVVSVAGCTSSTSSNQAAGNTSQAASTTANTATSASASATPSAASASATPSATRTPAPSVTPSATRTPAPSATPTATATPAYVAPTATPTVTPITKTPTVIYIADHTGLTKIGDSITFTFGVTAKEKGIPGQTVMFDINGKNLGSATTGSDGMGTFTFSTAGLLPGAHAVGITYSGNAQYGSSWQTMGIDLVA